MRHHHKLIKTEALQSADEDTAIAPDGNVWAKNIYWDWYDRGPADAFISSMKPEFRRVRSEAILFESGRALEIRLLIQCSNDDPMEISKSLGWVPYNYQTKGKTTDSDGRLMPDAFRYSAWQAILWCNSESVERDLNALFRALDAREQVHSMLADGLEISVSLNLDPATRYEFQLGQETIEIAARSGISLQVELYPEEYTKFDLSQFPTLLEFCKALEL